MNDTEKLMSQLDELIMLTAKSATVTKELMNIVEKLQIDVSILTRIILKSTETH